MPVGLAPELDKETSGRPGLCGKDLSASRFFTERNMKIEVIGLQEPEPGYILGEADVNGVPHHIEFYRVCYDENLDELVVWQPEEGENSNQQRFDDLQNTYEGSYHTIQLDGFEGEYVCCMFPFCR
jgi:hypothetical protein